MRFRSGLGDPEIGSRKSVTSRSAARGDALDLAPPAGAGSLVPTHGAAGKVNDAAARQRIRTSSSVGPNAIVPPTRKAACTWRNVPISDGSFGIGSATFARPTASAGTRAT